MEIITHRKFINKIGEIQASTENKKLLLVKYLLSFMKPCGLDLRKAKEIMDSYDSENPEGAEILYEACKEYITESNKFSKKKLLVVQNTSYTSYKCADNPYANQGTGEFACECICNKRNECKKYAVAVLNTVITKREL